MRFTDRVYDALKQLALVWLPATGALFFALARVWNLPRGEEIVGTITAVDAFLGAVLKYSAANYNKEKGEISDDNDEE